MARDLYDESTGLPPVEDVSAPVQQAIPSRDSYAQIRNENLPQPGTPGVSADDPLMKAAMALRAPPPSKEGVLSGTGKKVMGGLAGIGSDIAGAAEYLGGKAFGQTNPITQGLHGVRTTAQEATNYWQNELTPQEQDLGERQWTSLDPHQTIWQGGPKEFMHAVALQVAGAAPAALTTMLGAGLTTKLGVSALTYVGATQAGLSMGQLANNISDEIQNTPEDVLRQRSPEYGQLLASGMDPTQARAALTQKAQAYAPVIGGLVSGAIATVAGRFLTPILSKEGATLGARVAGGAADQALQQGGMAGADYIARETAAHTYDSGRAPDLVEAAKQTAEAGITGGLTGAGFGAFMGHGPVHEPSNNPVNPPEAHETMANTPEGHATGAATENHVNTISEQQEAPLTGGYAAPRQQDLDLQGGGRQPMPIEFNGQGQLDLRVEPQQGQLPLGRGGQSDMFNGVHADEAAAMEARSGYKGAPPPEPAPQEPPWAGPAAIAQRQEQLPLQGGQMNPPRPGPEAGIVPASAQMNLPFEQRQVGVGRQATQPMVEPPRTVAEQLRAKQAARTPDENQPDLFRDQPVPGQLTTRTNRPMLRGTADNPTAEPFGDIQAQLKDLQDPNHDRQGVYLSADNIERLRRDGLLDQVRQSAGDQAVPMVNFDEKGGTLIAKNQDVAAELAHYRDNKVGSMQEILGHATGAGVGKPEESNFVVQQHDDQGNVTRESSVGTEEEAHQLAQQYTDVARGRTAQIMSAPAAILRRSQLIGLEREHTQRAQAEKGAERATSTAVDRNVTGGQEVQSRALGAARRDVVSGEESPARSPEEAASRLTAEARRLHNEAQSRAWPGTGVLDPTDIVFASPDAARKYQELHDEFLGTQVMRRSTVHPEDAEKGRVGQEITERRIETFLKTHPHETKAEQVARAAVEVSREGVQDYLKNKRAPGRQYVEPRQGFNPEVLERGQQPSRAEIHEMNETELQRVYDDVVERSQGGARTKMTAEEMRSEDEGVRSKMEKRINRFFRSQEKHEELGNAHSEKMAVSPRRALTEREERVNTAKIGTKSKRLVGYKTFDPEALMSSVESQREMERAASMSPEELRAERVQQYKNLTDSIKKGETHLDELMPLKRENIKSGESPLMAQRYMRELLQYGRALRDQNLRSPEARSAAKKFNTLIDALGKKEPAKRAQYLIDTFKTELQRQARSSARANPEAPARVERFVLNPDMPERQRDESGEPQFSNYQLRHEYEVARRRREEGVEPEINPEPFAGRQAEHEGAIARRDRLEQSMDTSERGYSSPRAAGGGVGGVREAATEIANRMERKGIPVLRGHEAIRAMLNNLDPESPLHDLFTKLQNVIDPRTLVGYTDDVSQFSKSTVFGNVAFPEAGPKITINRTHMEYLRGPARPRG